MTHYTKKKKNWLFTLHDYIYLSLARICCMDFFTDCYDAKNVNLEKMYILFC